MRQTAEESIAHLEQRERGRAGGAAKEGQLLAPSSLAMSVRPDDFCGRKNVAAALPSLSFLPSVTELDANRLRSSVTLPPPPSVFANATGTVAPSQQVKCFTSSSVVVAGGTRSR